MAENYFINEGSLPLYSLIKNKSLSITSVTINIIKNAITVKNLENLFLLFFNEKNDKI